MNAALQEQGRQKDILKQTSAACFPFALMQIGRFRLDMGQTNPPGSPPSGPPEEPRPGTGRPTPR